MYCRVHYPAVSHCLSVDYRRIFRPDYYVFVIQHGKYRYGREVVGDFADGGGPVYGHFHRIYFGYEVVLDEVLVSLDLGRAVASYGLVPVACMRIVERVDAKVKHPVIEGFVFKDDFVYGPFRELVGKFPLADEMVSVEIAFVDREEVYDKQEAKAYYGSCEFAGFLPVCL